MTSSISIEDLRQAFTDWHKLTRLANNPITRLNRIVRQVSELPSRTPQTIAGVIHSVLLNALDEMRRQHWIHSESYLDVVRGKPLIVLHYVEQQPANKTCTELSISQATYYRYLALEFVALTNLLKASEEEQSPNNTSQPTPQTRLIAHAPALPTDNLPRLQLIDSAIKALTADIKPPALALLGLPGAGKTTLAVAFANLPAIQQQFPDGVLWMELGPGNSVERCLSESLAALHVDSQSDKTPFSRESLSHALRNALSNKRMLIVLDDVWDTGDAHMLMAGGEQSCHVVTTRSPALAYALAGGNVVEVGEFTAAETRHLLNSYLQASNLILGDPRLPALSDESVERVNRLPLSVVLIGKHLRYLANTHQEQRLAGAIQQISALALPQATNDLDRRIETSVEALRAETRVVAACLAVFPAKPNSFSHGDALAVAGCTQHELNELIDMGLVEVWRGRLTMHSSIHSYFAERYASDLPIATKRLVEYFLTQLRVHDSHFGLEDTANIATAIQHASTHANADGEAQLIRHSAWLFEQSGELNPLAGWIQHAQDRRPSTQESLALAAEAARIIWLQGDAQKAAEQLDLCMKEAQRLGLDEVYTKCKHTLSYIQVEREQEDAGIADAHEAYERVPPAMRHTLDQSEIAAVRQLVMRSRFDNLRNKMARVVVKLAGKQVQRADIVLASAVVAWLDYLNGDVTDVEQRLRHALASPHTSTHPLIAAITQGALARQCCFEGRYAEAEAFAYKCLEPATQDASPEFTALAYDVLGLCQLARDHFEAALHRFHEGLSFVQSHRNPLLKAALLASLCQLHLRMGDVNSTQEAAQQSAEIADLATDPIMRCSAQTLLAAVASARRDLEIADELFNRAKQAGAIGSSKENRWSALQYHLHLAEHNLRKQDQPATEVEFKATLAFAQQLRARADEGRAWWGYAQTALLASDTAHAAEYGQRGLDILASIGHALANDVGKWLLEYQLASRTE